MNKKAVFYSLIAIILLWAGWYLMKPASTKTVVSSAPADAPKHSKHVDEQIDRLVNTYMGIKDALVEWDTTAAKENTRLFIQALNSIDTMEIQKDTSIVFAAVQQAMQDMQSNAKSLLQQVDITDMRKDFSSLSDMMYPGFFTAIQYEGPRLYLQNCPMAFNDEIAANWISTSNEVINPYLGKKHPTYQSAMLHCGEVKDSIK